MIAIAVFVIHTPSLGPVDGIGLAVSVLGGRLSLGQGFGFGGLSLRGELIREGGKLVPRQRLTCRKTVGGSTGGKEEQEKSIGIGKTDTFINKAEKVYLMPDEEMMKRKQLN